MVSRRLIGPWRTPTPKLPRPSGWITRMIVSDATPLIAFARIGELTLLERIVHHVTLPETVWGSAPQVMLAT
jgi:hypothetical protein